MPKKPPATAKATLPDFELAELRGFDPAAFDTNPKRSTARFILVLAAVFNDLKGAFYVVERLRAAKPIADQTLASRGQLAGMAMQNARVICGILHELMEAIREHKSIVESSEFQEIVARLPGAQRDAWTRVKRVALEEDKTLPVTTDAGLLLFIRNKLGFHYDDKVLAKGYRDFFADASKPLHDAAIVSDGDRMETTRFYFADAAIEESLSSWTEVSAKQLPDRISNISRDVNMALKFIVMAYIKKVAKPSRYEPGATK
jgi:hypothetical protein